MNKGALHSQRNLSSVSFRIKKLKNEAKGARRSLWLETSKPQPFLSGLNMEPRPEGHEEAHSVLALFWHRQKHISISRTIYKPLTFLHFVPFLIIFWLLVTEYFMALRGTKNILKISTAFTEITWKCLAYFEDGILKLNLNVSLLHLMILNCDWIQNLWCLRKQGLIKQCLQLWCEPHVVRIKKKQFAV